MSVERVPTRLEGPLLLAPAVFGDERGFLIESYRREWLIDHGVDIAFVQDNHSRSSHGVVRGMHYKVGDGMAKLVRCARGSIVDVIVDLRRNSATFGEWEAFELDDRALRVLLVPVGFAHGFCVTSQTADVIYKCSSYYEPDLERGIAWNDPDVGIDWPDLEHSVSDRDSSAPLLRDVRDELPFS